MKKEIEFQKKIDVVSTVEFLGIEDGDYMFSIKRHYVDGMFDDEEEEAQAIFNIDGGVEVEYYSAGYEEEVALIEEMMHEIKDVASSEEK
jgi:hypothetical protein